MELEGFGASLAGRGIYVVSDAEHAWIPWEFVSGTSYTAKILVTGDGPGLRCVEAENNWTAIFRPSGARDWSCIATMIKGMGNSVLLVIDHHAPAPPPAFIVFLDGILAEGRIVLTRIWIGTHMEIPAIPDALFFPVLRSGHNNAAAYDMMMRLPARAGHSGWKGMPVGEWNALVAATAASDLGMVISDIGENGWTLFWHKIADSVSEGHGAALKKGLAWLRTGSVLIEKTAAHSK